MSISDNYVPDVSTGNSVTVAFSGSWNVIAAAYFVCQLKNIATGALTTLNVPGSDGTLAFTSSGYTATLNVAPSSAYQIVRSRNITKDQNTPYKTSLGFQGLVEENSFDKVTAISQDIQEQVNRTLLFPIGSTVTGVLPVPTDGYGLVWSGTGGALRNTTSSLATLETQAAALYAIAANITTVAGISASVTAVAANSGNINTVAANIANVNIVGGISGNVTTVAGISGNVTTVAGISANVTTVAGIAASVSTVAGISANVTSVAGNSANINTVATNIANVNLTGGSIANVNSVASDLTNINNVAADLTNINNVAADLTNINNASANAAAAAASAVDAANFAAGLIATSTTSLAIAIASKTFTTQSGKQFAAGQFISAVSAANNANYMHGQVTSYSGTTLIVNVTDIGGSGTKTDWNISVSGSQGTVGNTGAAGSIPIAAAAGTVDAITATPSGVTLADQTLCAIVSSGANTVTNPTFAPNALTAHTITKNGGSALVAGDTGTAGYVMLIEYNLANTRWELLNPAKIVSGDISGAVAEAKGGTNQTTYAAGDILYASATNVLSKLAKGADTNVLTLASGLPSWAAPASSTQSATTFQRLTSGSGATYTKPAGCTAILVRALGGGGGGGQGTAAGSTGNAGGTTTFNSINAAGGSGGDFARVDGGAGGAGGTGGTGAATFRMDGNVGGGGSCGVTSRTPSGGNGGVAFLGGGGAALFSGGGTATDARANSGSGGGGGGGSATGVAGAGGGGAGEYFELYIASPSSTYTYTIGAGGAATTNVPKGSAGGSGIIIVEEFYG